MGQDILQISVEGAIATLVMNRPEKRNAMCEELLHALEAFFAAPPSGVKVAILTGTAGHYCSGLICPNMCIANLKRIFIIPVTGIR